MLEHIFLVRETSSSSDVRLRFARLSKMFGSIFSESETSGEGACLLRFVVGLGAKAVGELETVPYVLDMNTHTILPVLDALQASKL